MTNPVQPALHPRSLAARAEKSGERAASHGFDDILRIKPGRLAEPGADAKGGAEPAPAPLPPAWRIRVGEHDLAAALPAMDTPLPMTLAEAMTAKRPGDSFGKTDFDAGDETDGGEALEALPDIVVEWEQAVEPKDDGSIEEDEIPPANVAAPVSQTIFAMVPIVPPARSEQGAKIARAAEPAAAAPDTTDDLFEPGIRKSVAEPSTRWTVRESIGVATSMTPTKAASQAGGAPAGEAARAEPPVARQVSGMADEASGKDEAEAGPRAIVLPAMDRTEQARPAANVRVLESQSLPAPAQGPVPAATISNAIAASPGWMSLARNAPVQATATASVNAGPIKSLTIQLHPAELGSVTARMRLAGDQLTIELQVEKAEAFDRLSTDSETILKAVRALGIEVDRVTVQQVNAQSAVNARAENNSQFNGGGGRETGSSLPGSGGQESGGAGGRPARNDPDETHAGRAGPGQSGPAGDERGLYI